MGHATGQQAECLHLLRLVQLLFQDGALLAGEMARQGKGDVARDGLQELHFAVFEVVRRSVVDGELAEDLVLVLQGDAGHGFDALAATGQVQGVVCILPLQRIEKHGLGVALVGGPAGVWLDRFAIARRKAAPDLKTHDAVCVAQADGAAIALLQVLQHTEGLLVDALDVVGARQGVAQMVDGLHLLKAALQILVGLG